MEEYDVLDIAFYMILTAGVGSLGYLGYTIYEVYKKSKNERETPKSLENKVQTDAKEEVKGEK